MHNTLPHILSATIATLSALAHASLAAEEMPQPSTIRLPGIYHVWDKETKDMPSITFDELEECMSSDAAIRQRFDSVQLETKLMNEEVSKAENMVQENQNARLALEKEAGEVQSEISAMNTLNDQLSQRKQALSVQTRQRVDAPTAKKINQQVDQFNKDIIKFNADSSALKDKTQQLKAKQQQFNDDLEGLKNQLEQLNSKTSAFNARKKSFDQTLLSFKDKCTGAHKLEK